MRRRLVTDFGESPTDPAYVDRASVMSRLLDRYMDEGLLYFEDDYDDDDLFYFNFVVRIVALYLLFCFARNSSNSRISSGTKDIIF